MAAGFSLKDRLFNAGKIRHLAGLFGTADAGFDAIAFEARVMARLPELELKRRIDWIAECLDAHLPHSLPEAAPVLLAALPPPLDPALTDDDFGDFIFAPLGAYVVLRGLRDHAELSLDLIEELTQRFSMEWAIRPFLNRWPDLVLARMSGWAHHPNYHVRRLVSEGTRPRLPWGMAVELAMTRPLDLLDVLQGDATRYVTRSVANHLNDITKKDPDLAMDRLCAWRLTGVQTRAEIDWMTRHALRGLIKSGHPRAMKMLGFDPAADIELLAFDVPGRVAIGGVLRLAATLRAPRGAAALVDFVLWRNRADGRQSPRVFKLKQLDLPPGRAVDLRKAHRLKGDATTFRLHPGPHRVELMVNGRVLGAAGFDLVAPETAREVN
jgi:3-methyladenine DNA glycosylase AlkC